MTRPIAVSAFFALLVSLLVAPAAHATIAEAMTMEELVSEADHAALVEVIALEPSYDELDRIVTDATVRVIEPLVGPSRPGETLVVRRLGGTLGGLALRVEGEATFELGERVVLFAREVSGVLRPVGMSQGVLPVDRDDRGNEIVLPGGAGLALVRPGDTTLAPAHGALEAPMGLDELLAEVRALGETR